MKSHYKVALFAAVVFFAVVGGYFLLKDAAPGTATENKPVASAPSSTATSSSTAGNHSILPTPLTTPGTDTKAEELRRQVNERLAAINSRSATTSGSSNSTTSTGSTSTPVPATPVKPVKPTTMTFNGSPIENVLTPKPAPADVNPAATTTTTTTTVTPPVITTPIPTPPPAPATRSTTYPKTYAIQSGDTLSSIALTLYGSDRFWVEIAQANPTIDPLKLKPGQTIKLPQPADLRKTSNQRLVDNDSSKGAQYTVRAGDNLSTIAQEFYKNSAMWRRIYNANKSKIGSNPDTLQAGVTLDIPPAESGTDH
jgi:nucleoid-associated protein YgaU